MLKRKVKSKSLNPARSWTRTSHLKPNQDGSKYLTAGTIQTFFRSALTGCPLKHVSCYNPADTNLMRSMFMYVGVEEVNTSVRNVASAARSPACCANTSAPTRTSGPTTAGTVTSPSRQKVWTVGRCLLII